jgi:hypothetical protein
VDENQSAEWAAEVMPLHNVAVLTVRRASHVRGWPIGHPALLAERDGKAQAHGLRAEFVEMEAQTWPLGNAYDQASAFAAGRRLPAPPGNVTYIYEDARGLLPKMHTKAISAADVARGAVAKS